MVVVWPTCFYLLFNRLQVTFCFLKGFQNARYAVAYEMNQAASAAGYPQRDPYIPSLKEDKSKGIAWHEKMAFEINSLRQRQ